MKAGGAQSIGTLSIEIVAEVARLQADMRAVQRAVGDMSTDVARKAKVANDNLAGIGKGASAGVREYSRDVAALKAQIDPAWKATQIFREQQALATRAWQEGAITAKQYTEQLRANAAAYKQSGQAVTTAAGSQRVGLQQLGYQFSDVAVQMAGGTRAALVFAQQGPQVVQAIQMMAGGTSKFANFMGGPWGIAIMVGVSVLGALVSKMTESEKKAKDAERAHETLADKLDLTKHSYEEATAALREYNAEQSKSREITLNSAEAAAKFAAKALEQAIATRKLLQAELERADANARANAGQGVGGGAGAFAAGQLVGIAGQANANAAAIKMLEADAKNAVVGVGRELAKLSTDPRYAIEQRFARMRNEAEAANLPVDKLTARLTEIGRQEQKALKALQDSNTERAKAVQYGREINVEQAKAIARAAGMRPGSGLRTIAEQQWLYDNKRTKENPVAKPNANAPHVRGNALDIPFGPNVSVEAIKKAYAAEGVRLTKILKETGHFHIEWSTKGADKVQREADQQKESTDRFIESLEREVAAIGKTPKELREMEVAQAKAAATTDEQRKAIDELSAAREKGLAVIEAEKSAKANADWDRTTLQPLRYEMALLGLTGQAREDAIAQQKIAALASEEQTWKAHALAQGLTDVNQKWADYFTLQAQLLQSESVLDRDKQAAEEFADALRELNSIAGEFRFGEAFGQAGSAIEDVLGSMDRLSAGQAAYAKGIKAAGKDQTQIATLTAAKKKLEVNETFALIGATKSLFKEKSTGYKVMEAAERAYAAYQMVNTAISVAQGAAKIFGQGGIAGFVLVPAMLAIMASLGFSGGGGNTVAPPSAEDLQNAAGTGSVLGDTKAKSDSIANALEIVAANSNSDLEYTNEMLKALRSIDDNIRALSGDVARQITVSGSMFDTSKLRLGSSGSGGFLGIGASSTDRTLYDLGLELNAASVGQILNGGISGSTYQTVQQIKKNSGFLGLGGGTKTTYQTTNGSIDASITQSIADVVSSLRNGLVEASKVIGITGAEAVIDAFNINIGQISFKDMTGEQIEQQLNAIFSKVGDDMAGAVYPALAEMQMIGEGLFETFVRVAREYQVVDVALKSIGLTFGMVGVASVKARDELVQLFGGLEEFVSQTDFFRTAFLSEAEQIAPVAASVREELARLGLAGITTRDQFKNAVLGLDLTTAAGREMYASLLAVAPAFDKVAKYAEAANKTITDAFKKTVDEFRGYAASLTKYRESLRDTQSGPASYAASRRAFFSMAGLAAEGNASGLAGLEGAGKTFLAASKDNATSLNAYLRDIASVATAVDKGIFAANETADYAQLQLEAANASVGILSSIDGGIAELNAAVAAMVPTAAEQAPVQQQSEAINSSLSTLSTEFNQMRTDMTALQLQVAENTSWLARQWSRIEGDGLLIRTDADTPIAVENV